MSFWYRTLGVVARINESLSHELVGGIPLNWALVLACAAGVSVAGINLHAGGDTAVWSAVAGAAGFVLVLFGQSQLRGNVVFRRERADESFAATSLSPAIDLGFSGRLTLDDGHKSRWARLWDWLRSGTPKSRWFVDVPAGFVALDSGDFAFVSYLDASLRFLGAIRLEDRSGAWIASAQPESLGEFDWGQLYLGLACRPALRIWYVDAKRRRRWAVLSFATNRERAAFTAMLRDAASSAAGATS